MGRHKGGKNRYWSKEDKLRIIKEALLADKIVTISDKYNISNGMLYKWIKDYKTNGEVALENRRKPGNPLSKYQRRKYLSYTEQLEYTIMKQKIEIERLKKGYQVKGDGANKEFVSIKDVNSKSSKN
jgi:transposase